MGVIIHGHCIGNNSPTYRCWDSMIRRCYDPKYAYYEDYGGAGITVCARWHQFRWFLADMGERPSLKHQIDRRNNNGSYKPSNCRWATPRDQARNRSSNLNLTYKGETLPAVAWAERLGMLAGTIQKRKQRGWSDERALSKPGR